MTTRKSTLMKSMTVVGLGSLLFLTGCGASSSTPAAESAAPSASASATATESASASAQPTFLAADELDPAVTQGMTPEQLENYKQEVARIKAMTPEEREAMFAAQNDPHGERLVAPSEVKAGTTLHVSGGKYAPGATIQVYVAEPMAQPSYDAATDMYTQVGEEVIITEKITATADAQGNFDVDLLIPATVAPHMVNVLGISNDGRSDLVMTTVVK